MAVCGLLTCAPERSAQAGQSGLAVRLRRYGRNRRKFCSALEAATGATEESDGLGTWRLQGAARHPHLENGTFYRACTDGGGETNLFLISYTFDAEGYGQ